MIVTLFTMLGFLQLPPPELYSDQTERGGETRAHVLDDSDGLILEGVLKGIIGREGTRVGFVGLRRPLKLTPTRGIQLRVSGIEGLKTRAIFKTVHRKLPPYSGELTFQALLEATETPEIYAVDLNSLRPYIRGSQIHTPLPNPFHHADVNEFALELKLSEQNFDPDVGLPFRVKVYFEER